MSGVNWEDKVIECTKCHHPKKFRVAHKAVQVQEHFLGISRYINVVKGASAVICSNCGATIFITDEILAYL